MHRLGWICRGEDHIETETVENTITVTPDSSGKRLDQALHELYPFVSRSSWQQRIRTGSVRLNGKTARPSRKLNEGDLVTMQYTRRPEPEVNRHFSILHEDEACLVLDKPPNLPLHPSGSYFYNTLYFALKETYGEAFVAHFVHRIDSETSGALLLARNAKFAAQFQQSFLDHLVTKEYLVAVEGRFDRAVDASGYLCSDTSSAIRRKRQFVLDPDYYHNAISGPAGEETSDRQTARTELFPVSMLPDGSLSLVRAKIHTGRTHQIRATMLGLGFPVVGDRIYGVDETIYLKRLQDSETDQDFRQLRINRTALHSYRLELPHPLRNAPLAVCSPVPGDMAGLFPDYRF